MTLTAHHRPAKGNASTSFLSTTSTNIENENDVSPIEKSTIIEETVTVATPTAPDAAQANATAAAAAVEPAQGAERKYPEGIKLFLIMVPVYISLFLVSLDRIIIATAIPRITDEFQSFGLFLRFPRSDRSLFVLTRYNQVILNGMAQRIC